VKLFCEWPKHPAARRVQKFQFSSMTVQAGRLLISANKSALMYRELLHFSEILTTNAKQKYVGVNRVRSGTCNRIFLTFGLWGFHTPNPIVALG
jgi:hypothetical protein